MSIFGLTDTTTTIREWLRGELVDLIEEEADHEKFVPPARKQIEDSFLGRDEDWLDAEVTDRRKGIVRPHLESLKEDIRDALHKANRALEKADSDTVDEWAEVIARGMEKAGPSREEAQ